MNLLEIYAVAVRGVNGEALPTVVIEIGYTQSLQSLHRAAQIFIGNEGSPVRRVICLKMFKPLAGERIQNNANNYMNSGVGFGQDNATRCRRLLAIIYDKPIGLARRNAANLPDNAACMRPVAAISFGMDPLRQQDIEKLIQVTGIHVENIFGNIPPCNVAGIPQYQITIPGAVLFEDVLLVGIQHPTAWLVDILPNPPGFI